MYPIWFQMPIAGVMSAFWLSNFAGQVIVVVLFIGSILAWSLMLTKFRELREAQVSNLRFQAAYRKEQNPVALYLKRQKFEASPLHAVYDKACLALGNALQAQGADPADLFMGRVGAAKGAQLSALELSVVRTAVDRGVADQILLLDNRMGLLAQAVTAAPLLGLLGTVWGVMESFEMVFRGGSAMLSAVAPGIAGALLTTVIGLLVAIPSAVGYNLLGDRIRRLAVETDNFSQELVNHLERQYLQQG